MTPATLSKSPLASFSCASLRMEPTPPSAWSWVTPSLLVSMPIRAMGPMSYQLLRRLAVAQEAAHQAHTEPAEGGYQHQREQRREQREQRHHRGRQHFS